MSNWWDNPTVPWAVQNAYRHRGGPAHPGTVQPKPVKFSIDRHLLDYAVLLFGGGEQWDISQLIETLAWTETFDSPATEMNITLAAPRIRSTVLPKDASGFIGDLSVFETAQRRGPAVNLNNLIKLGMGIRVFASRPDPSGIFIPLKRLKDGNYATAGEIFRGYIFTKSRSGTTSQDTMEITCFDQMVYLGKNDYDTVFKNQTATEIIRSLCGQAGLRMASVGKDFANTQVPISRMISYGNNLYDCCYLALQKNKNLTGRSYRLRSENGTVVLRQRKTPSTVWYLQDNTNIISSQFSESIEDLVTGVQPKTTGSIGRAQYGTQVVNSNLERLYGRMRKVQDLSNLKGSEVQKAIKTFMAENGKPKVEASITIPCVNTIRAGDLVKVRESDTGIVGLWYVSSVAHSIASSLATTQLQLVKTAQEADVQPVTEATIDGTTATNRHVTYDKIKGSNGKFLRYRLRAGIYQPSGTFQGQQLDGTEDLVKLDVHLAANLGKTNSLVQLQFGRLSIRCTVQMRGTYRPTYDVMVSQTAADHLGIRQGEFIFVYPLRKHVTGGTGSGGSGPGSSKYDSLILAAAAKYGVEAALIKGVMRQESGFDPNSHSSAGAIGLMQLMPGTAASMGYRLSEGPLTSPSISIKYGTKYLRDQMSTFHTIRLTLAAYNGGPGVARRPESSWPGETQNYVRIVTQNYQQYKQAGFGG